MFSFSINFVYAQVSTQSFTVSKSDITKGFVVKKIDLKNYALPKLSIIDAQYEEASLPTDASISPINQYKILLGKELKKPFALVRIPAFKTNEVSKKVEQLTNFKLSIEENDISTTTKPALKTTASNSVLATGNWYKIAIDKRGIYKIDYNFIQNKLGVNPSTINPSNIRIYGNGGVMLSESNYVTRPDDLTENSIQVVDGGDNSFDQGDYILFYANGPTGWAADSVNKTFYHFNNLYEDKSYYFINFDQGAGQRITPSASLSSGNVTVTSFDDYHVHDVDLENLGKFGKKWWGETFYNLNSKSFSFNVGNTIDSATLRFEIGTNAINGGNTFSLGLNGQTLSSYSLGGTGGGEDYAAVTKNSSLKMLINGTTATINLTFTPSDAISVGYLNYLELLTRRQLSFSLGQLNFRDWQSVGLGNNAIFQVQNANSNLSIWDITNPLSPVKINGNLNGTTYSFIRDASTLHEYIAFDGSQYLTPDYVEKVANQNLHASPQANYLIVTYPDFLAAANKLADYHRQHDNMTVLVATTKQVYNEFGSGSQDISAIRDFARMFYKRAGNDTTLMPHYLLLFGDASYDYKDRLTINSNYVPTYETSESEYAINGYCSDDFFSFLDDNESIENWSVANTMDLGVGRIPVNTVDAANAVVTKIMNYTDSASFGPWRINTTAIADYYTPDGNIHLDDAEIMANTIASNSKIYNTDKVYLSSFPEVATPGGTRCPDANSAINNNVYKGTFLMNYNGHGNITTLSHDRILTQDDYNNWKNINQLPIMVTATCTFSKFDDPSYVSSGEQLIIKPDGGAIALLTTTQLVYQYLNRPMNVQYLNAQFQEKNGVWPTFGEAFQYGKNVAYQFASDAYTLGNYRKFALLGDPALTPDFPKYNIQTDSIIDGYSNLKADTIKALGKYIIKGSVRNTTGQILSDFNGNVTLTLFDKPTLLQTINGPSRTFSVQNNTIYKGKASVVNGLFSITFITPKDINYDFGKGKISYYAENGVTDAAGSDTTATVGGFSDVIVNDNEGPIVKPFMNDSLFKDGGITGANTVLYVQLYDASGINVSGNSIGHDLTAVLDNNVSAPYILNDYYETAQNDFTKGYVFFPVSGLSDGKHSITVKAWDSYNNSGEGTVNFMVVNGKIVAIQDLMNYPNPFTDKTHFVFEHNHPGEQIDVDLKIYNTAGTIVRTINQTFTPEGSRSNEIIWDGTDNNGARIASGIYVYRMTITTATGVKASAYQKLIFIR